MLSRRKLFPLLAGAALSAQAPKKRPNIIFIMSDDHASHAISAYGSRINKTPHLDRIAQGGMRFDNCFVTNSICTPSRGVIMTGLYSHLSGIKTLADKIDPAAPNVAKYLQASGYQTALVGKWHLVTSIISMARWWARSTTSSTLRMA